MAIPCTRIIEINNEVAILNEDVYVGRGDGEIKFLFELRGFTFNDGDLSLFTGARVLVRKPNGDRISGAFEALQNNMIVWTMKADLIDEIIELGCHDFQIVLTDGTSNLTLPPVCNQLHVLNNLSSDGGNNSDVNASTINQGHVATGDASDIFTSTKGYNATSWANNDTITDGKLNKIETALSYLMDNDVVFISPVGTTLSLQEEKLQSSEISKNTTIVLPAVDYVADFTLYLNCTTDLKVTFQSSADSQTISLVKGYHRINFKFISDWIISC